VKSEKAAGQYVLRKTEEVTSSCRGRYQSSRQNEIIMKFNSAQDCLNMKDYLNNLPIEELPVLSGNQTQSQPCN